MSLILDALRKLDREKASRHKGGPNIASEILRPDSPRAQNRTYRYVVAFSVTALVAAGLTYSLVVGVGFRGKSLPPASSVSPAPGQPAVAVPAESGLASKPSSSTVPSSPVLRKQATAVPPQPSPAAKPSSPATGGPPAASQQAKSVSPPATAEEKPSLPVSAPSPAPRQQVAPVPPPGEPARDARSEPTRTPPKVSGSAVSKTPAASPAEKRPSQIAVPQAGGVARGEARKPGVQAADDSSSSPPPLKITGIVWNEEPSKRRAVINGSFLTEGSMIEGVKVVEILPTQVRFLYKGQAFQITVF
jgi:general secretion pathway protein B